MVSAGKKIINLFKEFLHYQQSQGIILIICAILALIVSNSGFNHEWFSFWEYHIGPEGLGLHKSLLHWVNDGLMAIFFLLVGLEIKRELVEGELSSIKKSLLPVLAALGGMVVPALLYLSVNLNLSSAAGWGIPMATDIAFALGVLSLLGNRVPMSLKIILSALAIVDDLGAIIVIALFYSDNLSIPFLLGMFGMVGGMFILNRVGVRSLLIYLIGGVFLWYFTLKSGIHSTIAGVLLAMVIPIVKGKTAGPAERLQHVLHMPVSYIIMPLFALANTGFIFDMGLTEVIQSRIAIGIMLGLGLGKALGIVSFSWLGMKFKLISLPKDINWVHMIGMGFLGGIGFTMSIFIALLAFEDHGFQTISKISILAASLASGIIGIIILRSVKSNKLNQ